MTTQSSLLPNINDPDLNIAFNAIVNTDALEQFMRLVLHEDLGHATPLCDITTATMIGDSDNSRPIEAKIVAREPGYVAGFRAINTMMKVYQHAYPQSPKLEIIIPDGQCAKVGDTVAILKGAQNAILILERPLLNLVSRLSGIATLTSQFAAEIKRAAPHSKSEILDTRKTTPGLRELEKYAVRCGGGHCHRIGLYDALLIKDNHLAGIPTDQLTSVLTQHITQIRNTNHKMLRFVEVEVDSVEQLDAVLACQHGIVDIILLDNMTPDLLVNAIQKRNVTNPSCLLEASGNVSLKTIGKIAATNIDRISCGALTHHATSLDFGLDIN